MANTINNGIPFVPENTIDPAAGLNLSLLVIDRLLQLRVEAMKLNTPPASPAVGSRYIAGTAPTGAWSGKNLQCAEWMTDSYWAFSPARVTVFGTSLWINTGSDWVPATAGGGVAWGGITGAIADQADLQALLAGKVSASDLALIATSGKALDASITDAGNYYASTNVEGALQEVGLLIGDVGSMLDAINGEVI